MYLKKFWSAFLTIYDCETPQQLFQLADGPPEMRHHKWIAMIREVVSERIKSEEDRLPSTSALLRHWNRTCWVSQFWTNSIKQDVQQGLPLPEQSGWLRQTDGTYSFDWDSDDIKELVKNTVEFLTRGCGCQKTQCSTNQCSCRRQQRTCGPACRCRQCQNRDSDDDDGGGDGDVGDDEESDSEDYIEMEVITMDSDMSEIISDEDIEDIDSDEEMNVHR